MISRIWDTPEFLFFDIINKGRGWFWVYDKSEKSLTDSSINKILFGFINDLDISPDVMLAYNYNGYIMDFLTMEELQKSIIGKENSIQYQKFSTILKSMDGESNPILRLINLNNEN